MDAAFEVRVDGGAGDEASAVGLDGPQGPGVDEAVEGSSAEAEGDHRLLDAEGKALDGRVVSGACGHGLSP